MRAKSDTDAGLNASIATSSDLGVEVPAHHSRRRVRALLPPLAVIVAELDDAYRSAMIVGHNPGIEGFIRFLTGELEPMPTAALAVIDLNIDKWNDTNEWCGTLQTVIRPKDVMK